MRDSKEMYNEPNVARFHQYDASINKEYSILMRFRKTPTTFVTEGLGRQILTKRDLK